MQLNETEAEARRLLEAEGFWVERIAPGQARRADFRVRDESNEYIIEVRGRQNSNFPRRLSEKALRDGVASGSRRLQPDNTMDGWIRDKAGQLEQTPGTGDAFRVLWVALTGDDTDFVTAQLRQTLYGLQRLIVHDAHGQPERVTDCYYYHHFVFFRTPALSGVVVTRADGGCLLANPCAVDAARFRASRLYRIFLPESVEDPTCIPDDGRILRLDVDVDRSDLKAKWRNLSAKYGIRTTAMEMSQWSARLSVVHEEVDV